MSPEQKKLLLWQCVRCEKNITPDERKLSLFSTTCKHLLHKKCYAALPLHSNCPCKAKLGLMIQNIQEGTLRELNRSVGTTIITEEHPYTPATLPRRLFHELFNHWDALIIQVLLQSYLVFAIQANLHNNATNLAIMFGIVAYYLYYIWTASAHMHHNNEEAPGMRLCPYSRMLIAAGIAGLLFWLYLPTTMTQAQ